MPHAPIKVISLVRTPERRASFQHNNPDLGFEFFDAVDGGTLTPAQIAATGLFQAGLNYRLGAYGIALSHHALWRQAADSNTPLTVAEDDAVFRADFAERQAELLDALPDHWDFVAWGFNFDSVLTCRLPFDMPMIASFSRNHVPGVMQNFRTVLPPVSLCRLEVSFGLPAYTISPAGARRFLKELFPLRNYARQFPLLPKATANEGIDMAMNQLYAGGGCHVAFPPLAATPNDIALSTIQNSAYQKA